LNKLLPKDEVEVLRGVYWACVTSSFVSASFSFPSKNKVKQLRKEKKGRRTRLGINEPLPEG
jgi:hypothetical protein